MKNKNVLWDFFASVKLALFTLITLAVTSIIGTIIPQNEPMSVYVQEFGSTWATIFKYLNIPDMYNSYWFLSFLVLFSINLTVCSIDRIPNVFRVLKKDQLKIDIGRLAKGRNRHEFSSSVGASKVVGLLPSLMQNNGWKTATAERDGGTLYFSEKGGWTRFGVYIVHVSILIIFLGAIIGTLFGYKASVMIAEGTSTNQVYGRDEQHSAIPIGFDLRCDRFDLTYYDNGMPKDYLSHLTVKKDDAIVLRRQIEVNDPLQFGGLTFYQSSYQAIDGQYTVFMENTTKGTSQNFIIQPRQQIKWPAENITFGIVSQGNPNRMGQLQNKIWFSDGSGKAVEFWAGDTSPLELKRPNGTYSFEIKQRFATGLQVAKDPGVWWVYIGCIMMILGLVVVFFLSHKRLWLWVEEEGEGSRIILSGNANKNKQGFENELEKISDLIKNEEQLKIVS